MDPHTWWLYEFATVLQGVNMDRSRLLGIHAWTTGLPLSCRQMQLLVPMDSLEAEGGLVKPRRPLDFRPFWMEGGEVLAHAEEITRAQMLIET